MSTTRKRGRKPTAAGRQVLPRTVTIDREWLRERIEWLDVHRFATRIMREVNDLASSYESALTEQQASGVYSERTAARFSRWGFASEHGALEELGKLLESVEHVVEDLREVVYPKPRETP